MIPVHRLPSTVQDCRLSGVITWSDINIYATLGRYICNMNWTASSEFGTYRLCEQRRFRRACASAQSRQILRCSLIQAVSHEKLSHRKPDPWPLWMAGNAQLKFVMTECSKTQIRLAGLNLWWSIHDAKPSSEYEILFASKTSSLLQEYLDEIVHWHFQNQA